MRFLIAATACVSILAGCASTVDRPLAGRVGLHIDQVIAEMGYPTSERMVAGRKLYTWVREVGFDGDQLRCEATYEVNDEGLVVDYDWHGQLGACNF
jgi:hypothetical protein